MTGIEIRCITTNDAAYQEVLRLRHTVLRAPLGMDIYTEDLHHEVNDCILTAWQQQQLIGCVLLKPLFDNTMKLRAMAVLPSVQGQGFGRLLVLQAEREAMAQQAQGIVLHARVSAKGFYEKLGYEIIGEPFVEVTLPHVKMRKQLPTQEMTLS